MSSTGNGAMTLSVEEPFNKRGQKRFSYVFHSRTHAIEMNFTAGENRGRGGVDHVPSSYDSRF